MILRSNVVATHVLLQWMTAGRGIVHCEMPADDNMARGLQLWVNLNKEFKMCQPAYQELFDDDIPRTKDNGVWVKVIAGESMGIKVLQLLQDILLTEHECSCETCIVVTVSCIHPHSHHVFGLQT